MFGPEHSEKGLRKQNEIKHRPGAVSAIDQWRAMLESASLDDEVKNIRGAKIVAAEV